MSNTSAPLCASLPIQPTLADLLERTVSAADVPDRVRNERASALRKLAQAIGKPLAEIPAHPAFLRDRMNAISPAAVGLSPARWSNIQSLVRAALRDAGLSRIPGRYKEPLAADWQALLGDVTDRQIRLGLSRFGHFCSREGIAPQDVSDDILGRFLTALQAEALGKNPRDMHRLACRAWNKGLATVPGWPSHPVTVPNYSRSYAIPWKNLPPTLTADVEAYLHHLEVPDLSATFRPLRPVSIATRRRQLHEFISALIRHGYAADQLQNLADLVEPRKVKDGLRFIINHARSLTEKPTADTGQVHAHSVALALTAMARHWVSAEELILRQLKNICRNLQPDQIGLRDKNRKRLLQFEDPAAISSLVTLPQRLMDRVRHVSNPNKRDALQAQLSASVEILLMAPIRIKNLAGLEIGRTMIRTRSGLWQIVIPGPEAKGGRPIEITLPAETGELLDLYVRRYRPLLVGSASDWLFPGKIVGKPKSTDQLRDQIIKGVAKDSGLVVNPHLFRSIEATLYLKANPGGYGVVKLALSHRSIDTTIRYGDIILCVPRREVYTGIRGR